MRQRSRDSNDGRLSDTAAALAYRRLRHLADAWHEIEPSGVVREAAIRFLRVHPLQAADALQLAAAFTAAAGRPRALDIVALDERLIAVARKEGFTVVEIGPG